MTIVNYPSDSNKITKFVNAMPWTSVLRIPYGRKMYSVIGGKLTAIIPQAMFFARYEERNPQWFLKAKIAGTSDTLLFHIGTEGTKNLYCSREDYIANNEYDLGYEEIIPIIKAEAASEGFECNDDRARTEIKGWYINGNRFTRTTAEFCVWIDKDGIHFASEYKDEDGNDLYPTFEDARAAYRTNVEVVDFEDNEEDDTSEEVTYTISVTAGNVEDAKRKLRQAIENGLK